MDPGELLGRVVRVLRDLEIPFFVTGSTATIAYGEPRFTNDIDIVVRLRPTHVAPLLEAFVEDSSDSFYLAEESIRRALKSHSSFNLIHPGSGLKVDFMVAEDSAFNDSRFARVQLLKVGLAEPVPFASPEDVVLKKLEYYREGGSQKHPRDIAGVLRTSEEFDHDYVSRWAAKLGVVEQWEEVRALS